MTGKVYGLGVGPGDPELITVKALRILRAVPVIAFPAPEQGPSLARAIVADYLHGHQHEIIIRMPLLSERFPAQEVYDGAAAELGYHLDRGRDVAVLCEGDPFFYGSFMYLFGRLVERYPVQAVPGVSSLTACAAAAGNALASRNDVLTVLPAPLTDRQLTDRLSAGDAHAIIKIGRHFNRVRNLLERLDLVGRARYVAHASRPDQRVQTLTEVDPDTVPYFSMILIHRRGQAWAL